MRIVLLLCASLVVATCASAAGRVQVSLSGARAAPTVGRPWGATLKVRPSSFRGVVSITAAGPRRLVGRATRAKGAYRVRLTFPSPGRWKLTARAGGSTSRLGSITVRRPAPLIFTWPTSVDVQQDGSLLVVENGRGRVVTVHPARGGLRVRASGLAKAFAAAAAPSGSVYVSDGPSLMRIDGGARQTVATAREDIGPIGVAADGTVYYATGTQLLRLGGGLPIATGLANPHGVAVAADGAVLVSDTANNRVLRVDPTGGGVSTLIRTGEPRGLDISTDGTIYLVEAGTRRVGRYNPAGTRLGDVGPAFRDPYAVATAGRIVFVVDTAASGVIRRVAADGTTATIPTG
jgi:streptogramin lyase